MRTALAMIICLFLAVSPAIASTTGDGALQTGLRAAEDTRDFLSARVEELARRLDSFLGGKKALEESTGTYFLGRASLGELLGETPTLKIDGKLQLMLPMTQEMLKIEIDTEQFVDTLSPRQDKSPQPPGEAERRTPREGRLFAGLLADLYRSRAWRATIGTGVEVEMPPDPYAKAIFSYTEMIGPDWRIKLEEGIFQHLSDGFSSRSQIVLNRRVLAESALSLSSVALWTESSSEWSLGETLALLTPVDADTALACRAGALWAEKPVFRTTELFADVSMRNRIYSTWLFADTRIAVSWPREEAFNPVPSVFLTLEMFFGEK